MPSRLRWRAVRHLVRWHQQTSGAPDVRSFAVVTAIAMALVAAPRPGVTADAPSAPNTSVASVTAIDGSTGQLEASVLVSRADVRWRVVRPVRPTPNPRPGTVARACGTAARAVAANKAADAPNKASTEAQLRAGVDAANRAELAAVQVFAEPRDITLTNDALCPGTDSMLAWYVGAERLAVDEARAAERAAARKLAKAEADRKARQASARKEARQASARKAARRSAARRAAARRAALRRAAARSGGSSAGWRVAPIVTWYGPGFYGNRTACGIRYTRTVIGVAHKTLPCGTLIKFQWHGMTAVAPVIDRGPYATPDHVFDFSAALSCEVFKPAGIANSCFTRHDVRWRVVGRVNLRQYLASH